MAILRDVLKESLTYYLDLDRRLRARLKVLRRGSVLVRRIGQKDYYYLNYRDGSRVVSRYLGRDMPVKIEKEIKERRLIKQQLKEVQENLRMLQRMERRKKSGRPLRKGT